MEKTFLKGMKMLQALASSEGPRGVSDPTPYNHYSLLRTTEDAFCIGEHLGHAGDTAAGVKSMVRLFQVK